MNAPAISDFTTWLDRVPLRAGIGASDRQVTKHCLPGSARSDYIASSQIEEYLSEAKVRRMLNALYDRVEGDAPEATTIASHYRKTFALLVSQSYGNWIHVFSSQWLGDTTLPLRHRPDTFPRPFGEDKLWPTFYSAQWKWCPLEFQYGNIDNVLLDNRCILPFSDVRLLEGKEKGATADIFMVKIDPEYDHLELSKENLMSSQASMSTNRRRQRQAPIYVLKSPRGNSAADYFRAERKAYSAIQQNPEHQDHFLRLFGTFTWLERQYLMFDYADGGTLENFMKRETPRRTGRDILNFWSALLETFKGLHMIHHPGAGLGGNGEHSILG